MLLDPVPPAGLLYHLGNAHLMTGEYNEAEATYKQALRCNPKSVWVHVGMAAMYDMSGREKEASEAAAKVLRANPLFSIKHFKEISPFENQSDKARFTDALRKAGLTSVSLPWVPY